MEGYVRPELPMEAYERAQEGPLKGCIQIFQGHEFFVTGDFEIKQVGKEWKLVVPITFGTNSFFVLADDLTNQTGRLGRAWSKKHIAFLENRPGAKEEAERFRTILKDVWLGNLSPESTPPPKRKPRLKVLQGGKV